MTACLNCKQGRFFAMLAPVCSSFVTINAGTHMRSLLNPTGREDAPSVQVGNLLASRTLGLHGIHTCIGSQAQIPVNFRL